MAVAVSGDGKIIASGDEDGKLIALDHLPSSSPHWDGDTQAGECLAEGMKPHAYGITSRVETALPFLAYFVCLPVRVFFGFAATLHLMHNALV